MKKRTTKANVDSIHDENQNIQCLTCGVNSLNSNLSQRGSDLCANCTSRENLQEISGFEPTVHESEENDAQDLESFLQMLENDSMQEQDFVAPIAVLAEGASLRAPMDSVNVYRGKIMTKRNKNKEATLKLLKSVGPLVGVSGEWLTEAQQLLEESMTWEDTAWNWGETKSRSVLGSCLMYVARLHHVPLSFIQISGNLGISESQLAKTYMQLQSHLPARQEPTKALDYIPVILSKCFILSAQDQRKIMGFGERLYNYLEVSCEFGLTGKDPLILAAIILLFALQSVFPKSHELQAKSEKTNQNAAIPIYSVYSPPGMPNHKRYSLSFTLVSLIGNQVSLKRRELIRHMKYWTDYIVAKEREILPWPEIINNGNFLDHLPALFESAFAIQLYQNVFKLQEKLFPETPLETEWLNRGPKSHTRKKRKLAESDATIEKHHISLYENFNSATDVKTDLRELDLPTERFLTEHLLQQYEH